MISLSTLDSPVKDALRRLAEVLAEQSDHERVEITAEMLHDQDAYCMRIHCPACKKDWKHVWDGASMTRWNGNRDLVNWIRAEVIGSAIEAAKTPCFSMKETARLAEWLTERVAAAGRDGSDVLALLEEAEKGRLAPREYVIDQLERLEFLADPPLSGYRAVLPEGHPLRKWEEVEF